MTNTTLINAQSVGGTAAAPTQATKLTLQSTTSALILNVQLAAGTAQGDESATIELCWATSVFSLVEADAPGQFAKFDKQEVYVNRAGTIKCDVTGMIIANGGYLYIWLNVPALQSARTITVTSVEL